ncbi:hypothetical protein HpDR25_00010 [Helicobacter pylori]
MRDYSELEIFEGNPLDKWNDIIFHASKKLSKKELERLLELLALLETFIDYADDQLAKLQKSIWMLEAHLA